MPFVNGAKVNLSEKLKIVPASQLVSQALRLKAKRPTLAKRCPLFTFYLFIIAVAVVFVVATVKLLLVLALRHNEPVSSLVLSLQGIEELCCLKIKF